MTPMNHSERNPDERDQRETQPRGVAVRAVRVPLDAALGPRRTSAEKHQDHDEEQPERDTG